MGAEAIQTFSGSKLQPAHNQDLARTIAVTLLPGTYVSGQVLGIVTSAAAADVDTITVDACTHSTLTLTDLPDGSSYVAAQDITPAHLATALNAQLGKGSVAVTGTYAAGAGGTYILTWAGRYLNQTLPAVSVAGTFVGGSSPAVANVHTAGVEFNAYGAYASGNSDGTEKPQAILAWGCTVDDTGAISGIGQWENIQQNAVAYSRGQFYTADLVGLDSTALTNQPRWSLLWGTVTLGEIELP